MGFKKGYSMAFYVSSVGMLLLSFMACGDKKENQVAQSWSIPVPGLQNPVPQSKPSAPPSRDTSSPIEVPSLTMKSLNPVSSVEKTPPPRNGDFFIPTGGESPVYPKDFAIGELGPPRVLPGAFDFAHTFLASLAQGHFDATLLEHPSDIDEKTIKNTVALVGPRYFRLDRGKEGPHGSLSFLFRYLGSEQSVTGELYLIPEKGSWLIQDLELENPQTDKLGDGTYRYDPLGYTTIF
jgi:hypothetical protein